MTFIDILYIANFITIYLNIRSMMLHNYSLKAILIIAACNSHLREQSQNIRYKYEIKASDDFKKSTLLYYLLNIGKWRFKHFYPFLYEMSRQL